MVATLADCRTCFSWILAALFLGHVILLSKASHHDAAYEGDAEVEEGWPFEISCEITTDDDLKWTIDGEEIPEDNEAGYTLQVRKTGTFTIRTTLSAKSAQTHHQGEYRCNGYSRDFRFLRVITGDEIEDEERDHDDVELKDESSSNEVILQPNKTVTLVCKYAKDDSSPVTWYKNDRRILKNFDSNVELEGRNLIIHVARQHDAGKYLCTVNNMDHRVESNIFGRYFEVKSPVEITKFPEKTQIIRGRILTLICKATGFPKPHIMWFINNIDANELKKTDERISIYSHGDQTNASLTIRAMGPSDRGLYTCRAENSMDKGKTRARKETYVSVYVRETASSDLPSSSTKYVQKGGKFTLACRVPLSGIHLWYKDGKPIVPNSINRYHLEQDPPAFSIAEYDYFTDMRLTIEKADSLHTGEYKCNSFGPFSQKVVVITENMIETNEDEPGMGKLLILGRQLILQCNTTECPQCRVVWYKDGNPVNIAVDDIKIYDDNNSLVINKASYNDSGIYVCAIDRDQLDVALNASISVHSEIKLEKFDSSSSVVIQGNPLELVCVARGAPMPQIKWFKGDDEILPDDDRIKLLDFGGLKNAKLFIEEVDFEDRSYYTCEAYNHVSSMNTTILVRIKDKLAALWPFLGICAEVAILCSIIFVYERRKSKSQFDESDTDHPTENKNVRDQKAKGHDVRQRK